MLFQRNDKKSPQGYYNPDKKQPVIRCSICNGEQIAGFKDRATGAFEEVMLLMGPSDLAEFRSRYGIEEDIAKIY